MGNRKFAFVPGEFYHVYNRGNSKQDIFLDTYDYRRFMALLFVANSEKSARLFFIKEPYRFERGEQLVDIGAYCLMPNHFHLLLTPRTEKGLSEFMQKLSTACSMYFNNRYERTGSLFEGKFKAELATDDRYLKYLYAYIHLNPVKLIQADWREVGIRDRKAAEQFVAAYPYSSFQDHAGKLRPENAILNHEPFPEYFTRAGEFMTEIFDWLKNDEI